MRQSKGAIYAAMVLMLSASLFSIPAQPVEVEFEQFLPEWANTGYISTIGGIETVYTNCSYLHISAGRPGVPQSYTYLDFDTSSIGSEMVAISARLQVYYYSRDVSPMATSDVWISAEDYGATLTVADSPPALVDWQPNPLFDDHDFYGWKGCSLNASSISTTGNTRLILYTASIADNIIVGTASVGAGTKPPMLAVDYMLEPGVVITYNFTAAGMTNQSMPSYPVEIIDQTSASLYLYEFWSSNQTTTQFLMPSADYWYRAVNPYAAVTNPAAQTFNFTSLSGDSMYWVWFQVNKTSYCNARISMYREATGAGVSFDSWAVYINDGSFTDETTMERVWSPEIELENGQAYTVSIYDYFPTPNFITNYTFIAFGSSMDVDVPVPYGPLNFKSWRSDVTLIRIYYNANMSASPYSNHVPGGEWLQVDVRGGAWTVSISYMTTTENGTATIDNTYFYNITVNSSMAYTIEIGEDMIQVISTTTTGLSSTLTTIETWLTPSIQNIYYLLPEYPYGGTRGVDSLTDAEVTYVSYHPYHVIDGSIRVNGTGTNVSLADYRPTNGTVRWLSDELYINSDPLNAIYVNDSTGNVVNYTTAPSYIDLTDYDCDDITVWSNGTIQVYRISQFRQVQMLTYAYVPTTGIYYTSATAYNPTAGQWKPTYWYIGYATDTDGDVLEPEQSTIRLYDVDNAVTLQQGANYDMGGAGVAMMFEYVNTTVSRNMQLSYYLNNNTPPLSEPILNIRNYEIDEYDGRTLYAGVGSWTNNATSSFSGGCQISLKNLGGTPDGSDMVLYDNINGRAIPDAYWTLAGTTIVVSEMAVGTVDVGESLSYTVYFDYVGLDDEPFFLFDGRWSVGWVNINAHLLFLVAALACGGYGTAEFVTARRQQHEAKGFAWLLLGAAFMLMYVVLYLFHSLGVL